MTETSEQSLPQIFNRCVAEECGRFRLTSPFESGGYYVATNGRICVRMPKAAALVDLPPLGPGEKVPDIGQLEWTRDLYMAAACPFIVPEQQFDFCRKCAGGGNVQCEYGHVHECPRCGGAGTIPEHKHVRLERGLKLRYQDADMLKRFGCEVYLRTDLTARGPLRFDIPGTQIEGLIMPAAEE
jgi:hypothetical protein